MDPQSRVQPGGEVSPGDGAGALATAWLLRKVLKKARVGQLSPRWRETEVPPRSDAHEVMTRELAQLAPAPWEPSQAKSWRHALDAWFVASISIETKTFTDEVAAAVRQVGLALQMLPGWVSVLDPATIAADSSPWNMIGGETPRQIDEILSMAQERYIIERDWLCAGYLAGLAAGGTPGPNWRDWLLSRAEKWSSPAAQRRVEVEVDKSVPSHPLEQLPPYWT